MYETIVVPSRKTEFFGVCEDINRTGLPSMSVALGGIQAAVVPSSSDVEIDRSEGQLVIVGGETSMIVIVIEQFALLLEGSDALTRNKCLPTESGKAMTAVTSTDSPPVKVRLLIDNVPKLSEASKIKSPGFNVYELAAAGMKNIESAGQLRIGGSLSMTVTLNED